MKSISKKLSILLVTLFVTPAFASEVIAELTRNPGFERNPIKTTVKIYSDGLVQVKTIDYRNNSKETVSTLALLALEKIMKLDALIESIPNEKLVDEKEGLPKCTDAPSFHYVIYGSNRAEALEIKRKAACHLWELEKSSWEASRIVMILDGLAQLQRL